MLAPGVRTAANLIGCPFGLFEDPAAPEDDLGLEEVERRRSVDPNRISLGQAINGLTGRKAGFPLKVEIDDIEKQAAFQVISDVVVIENTEQMRETLAVSAGASYRGASLEVGGNASYYRESTLDSYSMMICARVDVLLERNVVKTPMLKPGHLKLLETNPQRCFDNVGDQIVNEVVYGGSFLLLLQYEAETSKQYESIQANVRAAFAAWGGSGSYERTFSELKTKHMTKVSTIEDGVVSEVRWDIPGLLQKISSFPNRVRESGGKIVSMGTISATQADNAIHLRPLDYNDAMIRYKQLAELNDELARLKNAWSKVERRPYMFANGNAADARGIIQRLKAIEDKVLQEGDAVRKAALTYTLADAEAYDIAFAQVTPTLVNIYRPAILAKWTLSDGTTDQRVINQGPLTNYEDPPNWAGERSGGHTPKYGFSFELVDPPPGLQLEYRATFWRDAGGGVDPHGWVTGGHMLEYSNRFVTGMAFRLSGGLAHLYQYDYIAHCIDVGDGRNAGNLFATSLPPESLVSNHEYAVQGIRIAIGLNE